MSSEYVPEIDDDLLGDYAEYLLANVEEITSTAESQPDLFEIRAMVSRVEAPPEEAFKGS